MLPSLSRSFWTLVICSDVSVTLISLIIIGNPELASECANTATAALDDLLAYLVHDSIKFTGRRLHRREELMRIRCPHRSALDFSERCVFQWMHWDSVLSDADAAFWVTEAFGFVQATLIANIPRWRIILAGDLPHIANKGSRPAALHYKFCHSLWFVQLRLQYSSWFSRNILSRSW